MVLNSYKLLHGEGPEWFLVPGIVLRVFYDIWFGGSEKPFCFEGKYLGILFGQAMQSTR